MTATTERLNTPVTIYYHGAAAGNPGEMTAVVVIDCETLTYETGYGTSNESAYEAILFAMEKALERGYRHLLLVGHNKVVSNQAANRFEVRQDNLKPLHNLVREGRKDFSKVEFKDIRRENNPAVRWKAKQATKPLHNKSQYSL
jgi:ribonuclease HI